MNASKSTLTLGFFKTFQAQQVFAFFVTRLAFSFLSIFLYMGAAEYPEGRLCYKYDNLDFIDLRKPTFFKKDFVELFKKPGAKSIASFLPLLPESIRSQAVIVFKSGSLQQASPLHPRLLLFNQDASFILTFNGDPSQLGYESIETMSFNPTTYSFEFEEFVFPEDLDARANYLIEQKMKKELAELYDRSDYMGENPRMCLGCHREKPRPNWEGYPLWAGVLGQMHPHSLNPEMGKDTKNYGHQELEYLQTLLLTYEGNPRYKSVTYFKKVEKCRDEITRTNILFNNLLSRLNFLRLLKDIRCHPNYREFESYEEFIRNYENLSWFNLARLGLTVDEYRAFVAEMRKKQLDSFFRNAVGISLTLNGVDPFEQRERMGQIFSNLTESTARFQLVLKKTMNMDLIDYEMSLVRGTYVFTNGAGGILDFFKVKRRFGEYINCSPPKPNTK